MPVAERESWLALLAWYREMGVDAALGDEPIDWLAQGDIGEAPLASGFALPPGNGGRAETGHARPLAPDPVPSTSAPPRAFPTAPPDTAESAARASARQAATLAGLEAAVRGFDGCGLKTTAKNTCVYRGAPNARVMFIGEAPGREEDLEGKPFFGPAGRLLDKMMAAIGLDERSVHIANIVYWRPPGNRTPTPQEAQICRPFLERQIELVGPELLVLLGGAAAKTMLGVADGIMRIRGSWREVAVAGRNLPVIATLHPAYLLRTPAAKRLAWRDLIAIKMALSDSR